MIEVDISNVWGEMALPDLLAMEKEVFDAHLQMTEAGGSAWPEDGQELERLQRCAERIRCDSEVCVVVGMDGGCVGARGAMELLQGSNRNLSRKPRMFFAGNSLSTRQWNELMQLLEGKDYSVIVVSESGDTLETALAFRGLRWLLERKYGTDEANGRIYVVTSSDQGALGQMAKEAGWETFRIPSGVDSCGSILTAAGLLPMAVAGIDIAQVLQGAGEGKETYDLRSYENPVWLYAAVRNLLYRGGRKTEVFASFEPDFHSFGQWWRQLFAASEGRDGKGIFPATAVFTGELPSLGQLIRQGERNLFETMVRFAPPENEYIIGSDWKDLEGLNYLEGKALSAVEEQAYFGTLNAHVDSGVPVITMDCGALNDRTVGELFYFLELSSALSARVLGVKAPEQPGEDTGSC